MFCKQRWAPAGSAAQKHLYKRNVAAVCWTEKQHRETFNSSFYIMLSGNVPEIKVSDDHVIPAVFWLLFDDWIYILWVNFSFNLRMRRETGSVLDFSLRTWFTRSLYFHIYKNSHLFFSLVSMRTKKNPEMKNARRSNVIQFHHVCELSQLMTSSRGPDPGLDLDFFNSVFIVLNLQTR